jgi:hypothetical protein
LTVDKGKQLFDNGTIPAAETESLAALTGVIIANDALAGGVKTGTAGSYDPVSAAIPGNMKTE